MKVDWNADGLDGDVDTEAVSTVTPSASDDIVAVVDVDGVRGTEGVGLSRRNLSPSTAMTLPRPARPRS